jgi:hypothetical protein
MVQVSLILPPLLYLITKLQKRSFGYTRLLFVAITVTSWVVVYYSTYVMNLGSLPITILPKNGDDDPNKVFYIDFQFYNKIYMQPWYWVGIYNFGVSFGCAYSHYLKDKNSLETTGPTNVMNNISKKGKCRAIVYAFATFFIVGSVLRQRRMV